MQLEPLKNALIAAARATPADEQVPGGFEKRVLARLLASGVPDAWILWSQALWRAAVPCVLIVILCGLWSTRPAPSAASALPQQIENAVLGELNHQLASLW